MVGAMAGEVENFDEVDSLTNVGTVTLLVVCGDLHVAVLVEFKRAPVCKCSVVRQTVASACSRARAVRRGSSPPAARVYGDQSAIVVRHV